MHPPYIPPQFSNHDLFIVMLNFFMFCHSLSELRGRSALLGGVAPCCPLWFCIAALLFLSRLAVALNEIAMQFTTDYFLRMALCFVINTLLAALLTLSARRPKPSRSWVVVSSRFSLYSRAIR